jgi:hypothetical protein
MEPLKGSGPDTTMVYDPVHKVLFHFDVGNTVNLMRYDDKSVEFRAGGARERTDGAHAGAPSAVGG